MEVKQEFQWGVAIITFKDWCDWLDYENNVGGKMVTVSCFGRVFEYFLSHLPQSPKS